MFFILKLPRFKFLHLKISKVQISHLKASKVRIGFWKKATIDANFCFWTLRAQNYCHPDAEKIIVMIPSNLFNCAICISEQWILYVWWMFLSHRKFITYLVFTSPQLNPFFTNYYHTWSFYSCRRTCCSTHPRHHL